MKEAPRIGLVAIGGRGWMGGANYLRNLAAAIRAAEPEAALSWICGEPVLDDWQDVAPRWVVPRPSRLDRLLRRQKANFRRLLERGGETFLYPLTYDNHYNVGLQFPIAPALGGRGWAGWIPDFQHFHLPELFSAREVRWRTAQMQALAREAPRVVLSSRDAMADFQRFFPAQAEKAALLTFRVDPSAPGDDSAEMGNDVPERFLLVCNQFWPHKNHLVVFEALRLLRAHGVRPVLLCTGALSDYRGSAYIDGLRRTLEEGELGDQVRLLGLVPRARVLALLRRAVAVVQPSLFEGWSTVVEDARVLGRRCVLSDLRVHREQDPPGAVFFPPRSPEALAELLAEAWREWPAGPDPEAEAAALATAREQQAEFGRQFLAMARGGS